MRACLAAAVFAVAVLGGAASALPEPLETALIAPAAPAPEDGVAVIRYASKGEAVTVRAQRRADGPTLYTLVEPDSEDALSETQRALWPGARDDATDDAPSAEDQDADPPARSSVFLDPEAIRAMLGDSAEFARESGDETIYRFRPAQLDANGSAPDFIDRLAGEIAVRDGAVAWFRIFSERSFKPHPTARVNAFEMRMDYRADPRFDQPLMAAARTTVSGTAMFQSFDQDTTTELLDFTPDQTTAEADAAL